MKLRDCIKMAGAAILLALTTWVGVSYFYTPAPQIVQVEYYARIAAVYEGNINHRFFVPAPLLEIIAPQFIGKPLLLGHDWTNPDVCVGRIVDAAVKEDQYGRYVEIIVKLSTDRAVDLVRRGAYHSASIGFQTIKEICLLDMKTDCDHQAGHQYKIGDKTVIARKLLVEIQIHEVSFVNVPASPHARVLELADHRISYSDRK